MRFRSVDVVGSEHVGSRVTIRRRLDERRSSDVLGILEHADEESVTVRDKAGERHVIGRSEIVAARVVGPAPGLQDPEDPSSE